MRQCQHHSFVVNERANVTEEQLYALVDEKKMWYRIRVSCRSCIFLLCFSDAKRDVIIFRHETKNSKNKGIVIQTPPNS